MSDNALPARLFLVLNPMAGSCDAAELKRILEQECAAAGLELEIYETTGQDSVIEIARQARQRGYRVIAAAGGDGTVSQVASALVHSDIPLGVVPVGTANLFARELNIPLEPEAACRLLVSATRRTAIDAMKAGDMAYISHVSLGVYSKIAEKTSAAAKRYFRQLAYIWNALPELLGGRSWRFTLEIDGKVQRVRASFIMIANVGGVGAGALRWGPDIKPDDGRVDICIVRGRTLRDYVLFMWHVIRHLHKQAPKTRYLYASRSIKVFTRKRLPVRGDGEIIGQSQVEIEILPGAIQVLVPEPGPAAD